MATCGCVLMCGISRRWNVSRYCSSQFVRPMQCDHNFDSSITSFANAGTGLGAALHLEVVDDQRTHGQNIKSHQVGRFEVEILGSTQCPPTDKAHRRWMQL